VSNFPNSAADNQGTNAPRLCSFSAFALILSRFYFVSVSSLSRYPRPKCEVLKLIHFSIFQNIGNELCFSDAGQSRNNFLQMVR
jgi:hypothetical protein